jgi:hypothetical protein
MEVKGGSGVVISDLTVQGADLAGIRLDGVGKATVARVRVTQDGYVTAERRVVITRSRPVQSIAVALVSARPPAAPRQSTRAPDALIIFASFAYSDLMYASNCAGVL